MLLLHPDVSSGYEKFIRHQESVGVKEFQGHPRFRNFAFPTKPVLFRKSHPEPLHYKRWNLLNHLLEFDAEVVVVEEPMGLRGIASLGMGGYRRAVAADYSQQTGRPVVAVFHTDWIGFAERNLGKWVTRIVAQFAKRAVTGGPRMFTAMLAPSRYLTDKFNSIANVGIEHVQCHGTDCQEYHPDNCQWNPIPGITSPVLVNSGRIVAEKSIPVLLDAFEIIQRQVPDARMYILGEGENRRSLMKQAHRRFGEAVQLPGQFSGERLKGWYARADLYVVASETENFCSANLEALASGTPVIAAAAGGNVEQIRHGVNGWLFKPGDYRQLAEYVCRTLNDRELLTRMRREARQSALEYDAPLCTDRLLDLIHRLVRESRDNEAAAQAGNASAR